MTTMDDYKGYVKHFSHPNQFDFILTPPSSMGLPQPPDGSKAFRVFGKSLSVPSISSENQISRVLTFLRGTALGITYDTCIISFKDTKTLFFHRLFNKWMTNRISPDGSLKFYPDEYIGDLTIISHDKEVYKLEGLYPTSVGDYRLDNDLTDQYGSFDVTFFVTKSVPLDGGFS